jgi:hypothetical protein
MADTTETEEYVQLKLLINEESNKVVFAEAGKDFVDILCSFLTLPLGTIAKLSQKDSNMGPVTVGCLNSLYQSVVDLDKGYLWTIAKLSQKKCCCSQRIRRKIIAAVLNLTLMTLNQQSTSSGVLTVIVITTPLFV